MSKSPGMIKRWGCAWQACLHGVDCGTERWLVFGHEAEWVEPVYCMVCVHARSIAIVLLQSLEELGNGSPWGQSQVSWSSDWEQPARVQWARRARQAWAPPETSNVLGPCAASGGCWWPGFLPGLSTASHSLLLGTPVHRGPDQRSCVGGQLADRPYQRVAGNGRFSHWQPVTSGCPGGDIGPNTV